MAERLGVSGNYVYLVESGKKPPTFKLLRKVEEIERSLQTYPTSEEAAYGTESNEVKAAAKQLEEIRESSPERFMVVRDVIQTYHAARLKKPSLTEAEKLAVASAPSAEKAAGISSTSPASPGAGEPTAHKPQPVPHIGKRSDRRRVPPTEVPE